MKFFWRYKKINNLVFYEASDRVGNGIAKPYQYRPRLNMW